MVFINFLNLDKGSVMSYKENPNEFETFNFDRDMHKSKLGKFYGINNLNQNKNTHDDSSQMSLGQRSLKSERSKKFGFSFLYKNPSANNSNSNLNSKTFINNNEQNNLNVSLYRNENIFSKSKNASIENLRNLTEVEEVQERRDYYEGYDSNYDNSNFIETPKEGKNRLIKDD